MANMMRVVIGTIINAAGILVGGAVGLTRKKGLSPMQESFFHVMLGVFTVWYGLRLTWISLNGTALEIVRQLLVVIVSLMLGKLLGRLMQLQKMSNSLGQTARDRMTEAGKDGVKDPSAGFKTCAALFCAAPLGILGAVQDGLGNYPYPLLVKAVMDGLAAMAFVSMFGWGVLLSAVPVLALQGSITLVCRLWLEPALQAQGLVDPINATGGFLVFSVSLVILKLKKIELADYLPALLVAPLLTWILR